MFFVKTLFVGRKVNLPICGLDQFMEQIAVTQILQQIYDDDNATIKIIL